MSKKAPYRKLTDDEKVRLRDDYLAGRSVQWIAHEYELTEDAAYKQVQRAGGKRLGVPTLSKGKQHKVKPEDIALRLAVLLGLQPRTAAPRRAIPDSDLLRFATGQGTAPEACLRIEDVLPHVLRAPTPFPADVLPRLDGFLAFSREMIGVEPQPFQVAIAATLLAYKSSAFVLGRQTGKDWLAALFCTWESIVAPNSRILIVSEAQRQSDQLAERVMAFVARSPETFDAVTESSRERLRFSNGSEVYFLPATGAIRGLTEVTRAIVNEARGVPDETYEAVQPMLARLNGSLCLFSTPLGRQGKLYEFSTHPAFAVMQLPSRVNRYLSDEFLESE